jgi:hypothetical protein
MIPPRAAPEPDDGATLDREDAPAVAVERLAELVDGRTMDVGDAARDTDRQYRSRVTRAFPGEISAVDAGLRPFILSAPDVPRRIR